MRDYPEQEKLICKGKKDNLFRTFSGTREGFFMPCTCESLTSKDIYSLSYKDLYNSLQSTRLDLDPHELRVMAAGIFRPRFRLDKKSEEIESSDLREYNVNTFTLNSNGQINFDEYGKTLEELHQSQLQQSPETYSANDHKTSRLIEKAFQEGATTVATVYKREGSNNRDIVQMVYNPKTNEGYTRIINDAVNSENKLFSEIQSISIDLFPSLNKVQAGDSVFILSDASVSEDQIQNAISDVQEIQHFPSQPDILTEEKSAQNITDDSVSTSRLTTKEEGMNKDIPENIVIEASSAAASEIKIDRPKHREAVMPLQKEIQQQHSRVDYERQKIKHAIRTNAKDAVREGCNNQERTAGKMFIDKKPIQKRKQEVGFSKLNKPKIERPIKKKLEIKSMIKPILEKAERLVGQVVEKIKPVKRPIRLLISRFEFQKRKSRQRREVVVKEKTLASRIGLSERVWSYFKKSETIEHSNNFDKDALSSKISRVADKPIKMIRKFREKAVLFFKHKQAKENRITEHQEKKTGIREYVQEKLFKTKTKLRVAFQKAKETIIRLQTKDQINIKAKTEILTEKAKQIISFPQNAINKLKVRLSQNSIVRRMRNLFIKTEKKQIKENQKPLINNQNETKNTQESPSQKLLLIKPHELRGAKTTKESETLAYTNLVILLKTWFGIWNLGTTNYSLINHKSISGNKNRSELQKVDNNNYDFLRIIVLRAILWHIRYIREIRSNTYFVTVSGHQNQKKSSKQVNTLPVKPKTQGTVNVFDDFGLIFEHKPVIQLNS